jgi:hypothetical protein
LAASASPTRDRSTTTRALDIQTGDVTEIEPGVAPATREPLRVADPPVVDAEPDAVDQLQRRRPDAAHLAGDVPAVRVEAPVLEAEDASAVACGDVAAVA